ncbi:MAG: hypothetical protein AAGC85_22780 [Bacteroidota bacterium]
MKTWETLHALSKKERLQFSHWLDMELVGKKSILSDILKALLTFSSLPSRESLWKKSFPDIPYDEKQDKKLRKELYKLMNHLRVYLAYSMLKQQEDLTSELFLKRLSQLHLPQLFEEESKKVLTDQEKNKAPSPSYYELRYQVHKLIRHHKLKYKGGEKSTYQHGASLNQYFDPWWIHEKYLLACVDDTLEQVNGQAVFTPLMAEAEEIIQAHPDYPKMGYLKLMKRIMKLEEDTELADIFPSFQEIASQKKKYEEDEFSHLFIYLTNRSVRLFHVRESEETALLLFQLYRWGIDNDILLYEGNIIPGYMRAVIHTGLLANREQEVQQLIPMYAEKLLPDSKEDILALCQAKLSIHKKAYSEVSPFLRNQKFSDRIMEIESRLIRFQAEYELDRENTVEIEGPLNTLERFVREQKGLSENYKARFLKVISIFFRMIQQDNRERLENLLAEIGSHSPYSIKGWLREKILEKMDGLAVYH